MRYGLPRAVLAMAGLTYTCIVFGQFGGGVPGLGGGSQSDGSTDDGISATIFGDPTLDGTWTLEFEVAFDSLNPDDTGDRVTLRADVTVFGIEVNGRLRNPAQGEFNCTVYEGSARCESGRLLVVWPGERERQTADFEFVVNSADGRRAKGEARVLNVEDGSIRMYTVHMTKR